MGRRACLHDDLPDDAPGGGGVALGGRGGVVLALHGDGVGHGVELAAGPLLPQLVGDVVAGVRVRQAGDVSVGGI